MRNQLRNFALLALILVFLLVFAAAVDPFVVQLNGTAAADFQIYSIVNQLSGTRFSDDMLILTNIKISTGNAILGTVYYDGLVSDLPDEEIATIPIPLNDSVKIDVSMRLSEEADNRFQGIPYKLLWTFVANSNETVEIDLADASTLYSNFNINPGDTYGFSILVVNGTAPTPTVTVSPTPDVPPSTDPSTDIPPSTDPSTDVPPSTDPSTDIPPSTDPSTDVSPSTDPSTDVSPSTTPTSAVDPGGSDFPPDPSAPVSPSASVSPTIPVAPTDPVVPTIDPNDINGPNSPGGDTDITDPNAPVIKTGDDSQNNTDSQPLLIAAVGFLVLISGVFVFSVLDARKKRAEK